MPLEVLKQWVSRARPVWSISIMAAIVGVVMLGRRLYKMKQKGRRIPLRIAIDDKRASQFVARAARLNEAFSIVKRVPVIRPSLPAGSVTSCSMASLR
ncbi:uncharacterized protein A4U43_C09F3700 [Asparagus officinalis]|uniref:DUF6821 domain-containing protein n=2 Tax=Asparagus officinalis TaxID=4686 RepID=A0A5P1E5L0_ASPOF|nr:uncharacterized protein A4U43_C09F3700 [Asparagus officinalis]